jgi:hypothetical protein
MKSRVFIGLAVILILAFLSCEAEDRGTDNVGENLLTEASILRATGEGNTTVTKEGERYKISGTITASVEGFNGFVASIKSDPDDLSAYFKNVNRYTITCDFPDTSVKPIDTYGQGGGFDCYFENQKATDTTPQYAGNWQSVPLEEYNAMKGVGKLVVDKKLSEAFNADTGKSNVGDYHHLVIRVKFSADHLGKSYSFHISNVGVYGEKIESPVVVEPETPIIHANSRLNDAQYAVGAAAEALRIVPEWQGIDTDTGIDSRESYTYEWYSNNANSATGGMLISKNLIDTNNDHPLGWQAGTSFVPPTDTAGTFYYYVIMSYKGKSITSRVVTITVE